MPSGLRSRYDHPMRSPATQAAAGRSLAGATSLAFAEGRHVTHVEDRTATTDADRYVASAYANDRAHVFHSWSAQGALDPAVIVGALGSRMWDDKGNTYLDFSCQLVNVNIGHQHPKMV